MPVVRYAVDACGNVRAGAVARWRSPTRGGLPVLPMDWAVFARSRGDGHEPKRLQGASPGDAGVSVGQHCFGTKTSLSGCHHAFAFRKYAARYRRICLSIQPAVRSRGHCTSDPVAAVHVRRNRSGRFVWLSSLLIRLSVIWQKRSERNWNGFGSPALQYVIGFLALRGFWYQKQVMCPATK
jgi:hypothetical protein